MSAAEGKLLGDPAWSVLTARPPQLDRGGLNLTGKTCGNVMAPLPQGSVVPHERKLLKQLPTSGPTSQLAADNSVARRVVKQPQTSIRWANLPMFLCLTPFTWGWHGPTRRGSHPQHVLVTAKWNNECSAGYLMKQNSWGKTYQLSLVQMFDQ